MTAICCACQQHPVHSRKLCQRCYNHAVYNGTLADYPSKYQRRSDMLDTYRVIRNRLPHRTPRRVIAEHMGVSHAALEQAIHRARRAGERVPA